ncbi:MAG: TGS domain-containing protein, partial [Bacteroidales bacterium]|nr:TGS domain-containing protein [Bacteroidales bacterium]
MINITLPDGSVKQFQEAVTAMDIAKSISEGLARNVLSANVNGEVWDSNRIIEKDSTIKLNTWNDIEGKETFWHSSAHLLASAISELYPNAKFGIGPSIENGFYYDIDFGDSQLSSEDFAKIEQKMQDLVKE